ncbi:MAG: tetraacyldisaccharide 4'-kinase [Candidatus Omnitrophota bacterium]
MVFSIKTYFVSLMKDERDSVIDIAVKALLKVLSFVYTGAVNIVDTAYKIGLRRKYKVHVPVVSVGNITLGGTGKTPFTIFLADHFLHAGKNPAVLTRGYGKDESKMLRDELPDVPIIVGQDRVKSARWAIEQGRDVLILDDGFQHRRIARDFDILLLDSISLFGNEFLFPRGVLREPLSSLGRADLFALTKVDRISARRREKIVKRLGELAPGKPVILTRHRPSCLIDVTGAAYSAESLGGERIVLVSGIVDPDYFAFLVEKLGAEVVARLDYTDHHRYTQWDVKEMRSKYIESSAEKIIVTKKDYVKIKDLNISLIEEKLFVLDVVIDIIEGKEKLIAGLNSVMVG